MKLPNLRSLSGFIPHSTAHPSSSTPSIVATANALIIKRTPLRGDLPLPPVPPPPPPPSTITSTLTTTETTTSTATLNVTVTVHTTKELFYTHNITFFMPTYITSTVTATATVSHLLTSTPIPPPASFQPPPTIAPNLAPSSPSSSAQPQAHTKFSTPAILGLILGIILLLSLLAALFFFLQRRFYRMYRRERVGRKRAVTEGNENAVVGGGGNAALVARAENGAAAAAAGGAGWISAVGRRDQEGVGNQGVDGGGQMTAAAGVMVAAPPPAYMPRERNGDGGIEMGDIKNGDGDDRGDLEGPQTAMGDRLARGSWPSTIASWEK